MDKKKFIEFVFARFGIKLPEKLLVIENDRIRIISDQARKFKGKKGILIWNEKEGFTKAFATQFGWKAKYRTVRLTIQQYNIIKEKNMKMKGEGEYIIVVEGFPINIGVCKNNKLKVKYPEKGKVI